MKAVPANKPRSFHALLVDQGLLTIRKSTVEFKYKRIYLALFSYILVYAPSEFKCLVVFMPADPGNEVCFS
jgi:hypothetical protein